MLSDHGINAYKRKDGCRCDICRAANAAASRGFRAGRKSTRKRATPRKRTPLWENQDYPPTLSEYMKMRESW